MNPKPLSNIPPHFSHPDDLSFVRQPHRRHSPVIDNSAEIFSERIRGVGIVKINCELLILNCEWKTKDLTLTATKFQTNNVKTKSEIRTKGSPKTQIAILAAPVNCTP